MKGKRSGLEFEKHELRITETPEIIIHYLRKPNTVCDAIKFINTEGILAVTGDYGNWIFCREFVPSAKGSASDGYWREKLSIASCQQPMKYDAEKTEEEIKRRLLQLDLTEGEREYYESLLLFIGDGEISYMYHAYYDAPGDIDSEYIPFVKSVDHWFLCVLDGFDEICRRIKETESVPV